MSFIGKAKHMENSATSFRFPRLYGMLPLRTVTTTTFGSDA